MSARKIIADVLDEHRYSIADSPVYRCICGAEVGRADDAINKHRAAEIDTAIGGLTQERRDADDCDCGNEHHPSWCDDDCVRFDPDKAKSRWVSEWSESKP